MLIFFICVYETEILNQHLAVWNQLAPLAWKLFPSFLYFCRLFLFKVSILFNLLFFSFSFTISVNLRFKIRVFRIIWFTLMLMIILCTGGSSYLILNSLVIIHFCNTHASYYHYCKMEQIIFWGNYHNLSTFWVYRYFAQKHAQVSYFGRIATYWFESSV